MIEKLHTTTVFGQSMGRIGDALDNAAAESFFATLKRELGGRWESVEQARRAVFSWIAFYNHRRRHSAIQDAIVDPDQADPGEDVMATSDGFWSWRHQSPRDLGPGRGRWR